MNDANVIAMALQYPGFRFDRPIKLEADEELIAHKLKEIQPKQLILIRDTVG